MFGTFRLRYLIWFWKILILPTTDPTSIAGCARLRLKFARLYKFSMKKSYLRAKEYIQPRRRLGCLHSATHIDPIQRFTLITRARGEKISNFAGEFRARGSCAHVYIHGAINISQPWRRAMTLLAWKEVHCVCWLGTQRWKLAPSKHAEGKCVPIAIECRRKGALYILGNFH